MNSNQGDEYYRTNRPIRVALSRDAKRKSVENNIAEMAAVFGSASLGPFGSRLQATPTKRSRAKTPKG